MVKGWRRRPHEKAPRRPKPSNSSEEPTRNRSNKRKKLKQSEIVPKDLKELPPKKIKHNFVKYEHFYHFEKKISIFSLYNKSIQCFI